MIHALRTVRQLGPLALWVSLALACCAAAGWAGWQMGAGRVQARWDAAERAHAVQAERKAAEQRATAARAAVRALDAQQQIQQRTPEVRRAVTTALQQPLQCPATEPGAPPPALGSLRIPAAVVDGLRRAGADPKPGP